MTPTRNRCQVHEDRPPRHDTDLYIFSIRQTRVAKYRIVKLPLSAVTLPSKPLVAKVNRRRRSKSCETSEWISTREPRLSKLLDVEMPKDIIGIQDAGLRGQGEDESGAKRFEISKFIKYLLPRLFDGRLNIFKGVKRFPRLARGMAYPQMPRRVAHERMKGGISVIGLYLASTKMMDRLRLMCRHKHVVEHSQSRGKKK